jgi:hypothetical protein
VFDIFKGSFIGALTDVVTDSRPDSPRIWKTQETDAMPGEEIDFMRGFLIVLAIGYVNLPVKNL